MSKEVEELFARVHAGKEVDLIRIDIASLVVQRTKEFGESLGRWEKIHLCEALSALTWNVNTGQAQSTAWLRVGLHCLDKALAPRDQRQEPNGLSDAEWDAVTGQQIIDAAETLGG